MSHDTTEFKVPRLNANDQHVELIKWRVKEGDYVDKGVDIAEVESSKASVTLQSSEAGYIRHHFRSGQTVPVGSILATFYRDKSHLVQVNVEPTHANSTVTAHNVGIAPEKKSSLGGTIFSPRALDYIAKNKLNADQFRDMGLVTTNIIKMMLGLLVPQERMRLNPSPSLPVSLTAAAEQPVAGFRSERISATKRREIAALTAGQQGLVNSSLTVQFSSSGIRQTLAEYHLINGQMLPLILHEFAQLLTKYPQFLSFYEQSHIHYYDRINLGIAVDFGQDLRVPVIFDAAEKTAAEIAAEIVANGVKYINNEFSPDDLMGGTVTVTDLSGHDVLSFQPLLNERQAIILGVGGDKSAPGSPMTLTLVFDHRVLSGRIVGEFLKKLKIRLLGYSIEQVNPSKVREFEERASL